MRRLRSDDEMVMVDVGTHEEMLLNLDGGDIFNVMVMPGGDGHRQRTACMEALAQRFGPPRQFEPNTDTFSLEELAVTVSMDGETCVIALDREL